MALNFREEGSERPRQLLQLSPLALGASLIKDGVTVSGGALGYLVLFLILPALLFELGACLRGYEQCLVLKRYLKLPLTARLRHLLS